MTRKSGQKAIPKRWVNEEVRLVTRTLKDLQDIRLFALFVFFLFEGYLHRVIAYRLNSDSVPLAHQ